MSYLRHFRSCRSISAHTTQKSLFHPMPGSALTSLPVAAPASQRCVLLFVIRLISWRFSASKRWRLRIQLEFGRLTNMSVATRAKSGRLALQATLSGLTHAKCSQDR